MQTVEWTGGKLEERLERIDERFDRVDERFVEVNRRITETSAETKAELKELKQGMKDLQITFQRGNFALVISIFGVLVATILKGG
jgi:archaellum component FlaC